MNGICFFNHCSASWPAKLNYSSHFYLISTAKLCHSQTEAWWVTWTSFFQLQEHWPSCCWQIGREIWLRWTCAARHRAVTAVLWSNNDFRCWLHQVFSAGLIKATASKVLSFLMCGWKCKTDVPQHECYWEIALCLSIFSVPHFSSRYPALPLILFSKGSDVILFHLERQSLEILIELDFLLCNQMDKFPSIGWPYSESP